MIFFYFLLFLIGSCGLTQILTEGAIFNRIRPKYKYFHCSMCMGFSVGILVFLIFWFSGIKLFPNIYFGSFIYGCISSCVSFAHFCIVDEDGIKINLR